MTVGTVHLTELERYGIRLRRYIWTTDDTSVAEKEVAWAEIMGYSNGSAS